MPGAILDWESLPQYNFSEVDTPAFTMFTLHPQRVGPPYVFLFPRCVLFGATDARISPHHTHR
jgi:hypothetical protein